MSAVAARSCGAPERGRCHRLAGWSARSTRAGCTRRSDSRIC